MITSRLSGGARPRWIAQLAAVLCLASFAPACATVTVIAEPPSSAAPSTAEVPLTQPASPGQLERVILGSFESSSCDFAPVDELDVVAECGWLKTPMLATQRQVDVELPVVVFRSTGSKPAPDPIVYLHGGPASGIIENVDYFFETIVEPFLDTRDVVLFDQRGSGLALPDLNCDPAQNFWSDPFQDDEVEYILRRAKTCAWRLRNDGLELAEFNKNRSADDVMVLARELGYDSINLIGTSWGGLLATTVMTDHPTLVRSALLNSPLSFETDLAGSMPASYVEALDALSATCRTSESCASRVGNLTERFVALVEALDANPLELTLFSMPYFDGSGSTFTVDLDGEQLSQLVFGLLYSTEAIATIPDLIVDLEQRDPRIAQRLAAVHGWGWGFDFGFLTYMCTDIVPASSQESVASQQTGTHAFDRIDDPPDGRGHTAPFLCEAMKVEVDGPKDGEVVEAPSAPALVFSGGLDPITPLSSGASLASALPNGHFVSFDDLSHGALVDDCARRIALDFFEDPTTRPPSICAENRSPLALADAALSVHGANVSRATATAPLSLAGVDVSVIVPAGYVRDDSERGATWWREDAPYDLTALGVFAPTDSEIDVSDAVAEMLDDMGAFQFEDDQDVTIGDAVWTRSSLLSPFGIAVVLYERSDGRVAVFMQAYPEEIEALAPYAFDAASSVSAAATS